LIFEIDIGDKMG